MENREVLIQFSGFSSQLSDTSSPVVSSSVKPANRKLKTENRKSMKASKLINPLAIIAFAVILRLIPHPANVAPIAAMALFGGAYLDKKYALVIPLVAMFISDLLIGLHSTMPFVYGSFLLTGLIGLWLRNHKTIANTIGATLVSSLLFFIITNMGVWLVGGLYSKTPQGLLNAYFYAIPFFRNTIVGDLFYTGLFFGGYELILRTIEGRKWKIGVESRKIEDR